MVLKHRSLLPLIQLWGLVLIFISTVSCSADESFKLSSPDNKLNLQVSLNEKGEIYYQLNGYKSHLINKSKLGLQLKGDDSFSHSLKLVETEINQLDETWQAIWGENLSIQNNYKQLFVKLETSEGKRFNLYFKLFNDGLAFRYKIPKQDGINEINIVNELTEFNFSNEATAWSIPANFESYEMLYKTSLLSEVKDANTPLTFRTKSGIHMSIHEANLTDYAGMTLQQKEGLSFSCNLVPWPDGIKVKTKESLLSPWRTITVSQDAAQLVASNLVLNLNEPCKLEDTSWIEPMKYIGIWWGMHLGVETWTMGPNHGATTVNMKKYINFAADNNIQAVLAEGWNTGWENWGKAHAFDQVTPYADFDFKKIVAYADKKGVELIGHHETGGDIFYYEQQMEKAMKKLHDAGIRSLKTGYAGPIPQGHFHHGQRMVQHYRKVLETAAQYKIMVNAHEPIKATGIRRTYPNMMAREGARGMEWNGWSEGNPPEHHVMLPFTRCLGGPLDYTPGTFDILYKNRKNYTKWNSNDKGNSRVNTTLAKQLALWVCLYSPVQMASDLIENYQGQDAFQFFRNLPSKWEKSKVLAAEVGDYFAVARKSGKNWYIGAITDEESRILTVNLSFLTSGKNYKAIIYSDNDKTSLENNPTAISISSATVNSDSVLKVIMSAGGGQAIELIEIQ